MPRPLTIARKKKRRGRSSVKTEGVTKEMKRPQAPKGNHPEGTEGLESCAAERSVQGRFRPTRRIGTSKLNVEPES